MISMLLQIFQHTPLWVWGLLAGLVFLGWGQTRDRDMSLTRITALPAVMLALSFTGVISGFSHSTLAIVCWLAGAGLTISIGGRLMHPRGAFWSAERGLLHVPGSWLPMVLILALFAIKYTVGVSLAMHPALAHEPLFAGGFSLAYGLFSGLFAAKGLSLRRLATRPLLAQAAA